MCHLKAYVFDDDVLISGANLSTTYFTKRQDRYYLFKNAATLAAFVRSLVEVLLLTQLCTSKLLQEIQGLSEAGVISADCWEVLLQSQTRGPAAAQSGTH